METTILIVVVAVLYSIVALAFIVLPPRFTDSSGKYPALELEEDKIKTQPGKVAIAGEGLNVGCARERQAVTSST